MRHQLFTYSEKAFAKRSILQGASIAGLLGLRILLCPAFAQDIELVGSCHQRYLGAAVAIQGYFAHFCSYVFLDIVDVSQPSDPVFEARWGPCSRVTDIWVTPSRFAYITRYPGMKIVDVSIPDQPQLAGEFLSQLTLYSAFVAGTIAYVADVSGLEIISVADPASPRLVGQYATPSEARGIFVNGAYAYLAAFDGGLFVFAVTDPANPLLVGHCDTPGAAMKVVISGSHAYVADNSAGMQIVDMNDPSNPFIEGTYDTPGYALEIAADDNYVYLAGLDMGLRMFDVTEPANPVFVAGHDTTVDFRDVFVVGDLIYAVSDTFMRILRFMPNAVREEPDHLPRQQAMLTAYPNPFNESAIVSFYLPEDRSVTLTVCNLVGQRVALLYDGVQPAGEHSATWDAGDLPSGLYFARLETRGETRIVKMILLK